MIEHESGRLFILDEITYDQKELASLITDPTLHGTVFSSDRGISDGANTGYNTIRFPASHDATEWKLNDPEINYEMFPVIKKLVDKFAIDIPTDDVQINYYDVGFKLIPHTDNVWNAHIMFPILPEDGGAELIYHKVPKHKHKRATGYAEYTDNIDYIIKYSTEHPTIMDTQIPHSAKEVVGEPRVYLKFMIKDFTFDELKQMAKDGKLLNSNKEWCSCGHRIIDCDCKAGCKCGCNNQYLGAY